MPANSVYASRDQQPSVEEQLSQGVKVVFEDVTEEITLPKFEVV